jgi:hypothetical protein
VVLAVVALVTCPATAYATTPVPVRAEVINDGGTVGRSVVPAPAVPLPADERQSQRSALLAKVLAEARKWVGYVEAPPGSNLTVFSKAYPWPGPVPWCAIFTSMVSQWAGARADVVYPRTASVAAARAWFIQRGRYDRTPEPGDWIVFGPTGADHVELVVAVTRDQVTTVGGNTNVGPSVNNGSDGVYEIRYARSNPAINGYGHPDYGVSGGASTAPVVPPSNGMLPITGGSRTLVAVLYAAGVAMLAGGLALRIGARRRGRHVRAMRAGTVCMVAGTVLCVAAVSGASMVAMLRLAPGKYLLDAGDRHRRRSRDVGGRVPLICAFSYKIVPFGFGGPCRRSLLSEPARARPQPVDRTLHFPVPRLNVSPGQRALGRGEAGPTPLIRLQRLQIEFVLLSTVNEALPLVAGELHGAGLRAATVAHVDVFAVARNLHASAAVCSALDALAECEALRDFYSFHCSPTLVSRS